ncbi:hypothetical protein [Jannaschia donghaensis]|uniref:Efflux transporter, outer membrane factor (OMF) lipoprotein, NodT family n=1 Tax=Jannaschia donghaensis TaxID=420998 RepID=A0A0M6YFL5_9RHOB|nr:hypothetical protein [Jannaschia donghaensis]CTQ48569.1 efflux transporter, outer membrane factor (OMF) lipoprotein, NodT family [Jannaschia donghaensis]
MSLDAGFVFDLFGAERRRTEAAAAEVKATGFDLARARAELPALETAFEVQALRLAQLSGMHYDALLPRLQVRAPQPQPDVCAPRRMPIDAIRLRPDVQTAERRWRAATAEIGVTEAAILPSLT